MKSAFNFLAAQREAQRRGRAEFYAEYSLYVCTPLREARFTARPESG